ncbi:glycosyltransferase family A protein [Bacillus sp. Marseille-Q3570]|uniref:glycosyltransferase family A protein n=1 Tax=Bacillus sp. Marseille-Q3570 TaxID=2963522 RepID=UPI0021B8373B|nr:glycosyltransferase family A protein [Bacillus sp. Marseille-Q3570]
MKLEILLSTMYQNDCEKLLSKMNIKSDAIVVNQSDDDNVEKFDYLGKKVKVMTFNEKGVGLSRNTALMRSSADICLMADDDMVYKDNYEKTVINAFKKRPDADIIIFNVPINKKNKNTKMKVKKNGRVRLINGLKYGTVNIGFRRESIIKNNIFFSLMFGGGALYGSGEDSLFIVESLKKGLKIYSNTEIIAEIEEGESTWFEGFNEKYLFDRGALFGAIGGNFVAYFLIIQFIVRKRKLFSESIGMVAALKFMLNGKNEFKKR